MVTSAFDKKRERRTAQAAEPVNVTKRRLGKILSGTIGKGHGRRLRRLTRKGINELIDSNKAFYDKRYKKIFEESKKNLIPLSKSRRAFRQIIRNRNL